MDEDFLVVATWNRLKEELVVTVACDIGECMWEQKLRASCDYVEVPLTEVRAEAAAHKLKEHRDT